MNLQESTLPGLDLADYGLIATTASALDPSIPTEWNAIIADLRSLRELEDDWDGNGAKAPKDAVVKSAIEWAHYLLKFNQSPPSSIMVGPNGTILFNWQDENGHFDAEMTRPNYLEWMHNVPGRPARHGVFEVSGKHWKCIDRIRSCPKLRIIDTSSTGNWQVERSNSIGPSFSVLY